MVMLSFTQKDGAASVVGAAQFVMAARGLTGTTRPPATARGRGSLQ